LVLYSVLQVHLHTKLSQPFNSFYASTATKAFVASIGRKLWQLQLIYKYVYKAYTSGKVDIHVLGVMLCL